MFAITFRSSSPRKLYFLFTVRLLQSQAGGIPASTNLSLTREQPNTAGTPVEIIRSESPAKPGKFTHFTPTRPKRVAELGGEG